MLVTAVNSDGDINTATISGLSFNGYAILPELSHNAYGNAGSSAGFNITYLNGTYTNFVVANGGSGYVVGDSIVINGSSIQSSGATSFNNIYATVTGISSGGEVLSLTNLTQVPTNRTPGTYTGVASSGGGGSTYTVVVQPVSYTHLTLPTKA